jgi:hypothetical protein
LLAAVKGWVLAMLAPVALRVAPVPAAPPLTAAARAAAMPRAWSAPEGWPAQASDLSRSMAAGTVNGRLTHLSQMETVRVGSCPRWLQG